MTAKSLAVTLAIIIVISWTHCYNRIADLETQLEAQQYDKH